MALAAAVAAGLAVWAYNDPHSGVTGTIGALLAIVGAGAVTLGALVAMAAVPRGGLGGTLDTLIGLGAVLTALAGYFLMQFALAALMAVAFVALIAASARRARSYA